MSNEFVSCKITKTKKETKDSLTVYLKPGNDEVMEFEPGQFLTLEVKENGDTARRCYSICTTPAELPEVGVTIKRVEGGTASGKLHETLQEGDTINVLPPLGNFTLPPADADARKVVLFGAGSGITPLMSILRHVLSDGKSEVVLFYGNRAEEDIIFKDILDELENENDRLKVVHTLTQPGDEWQGETGRIDDEKAAAFAASLDESFIKKGDCFLCGPAGMMDSAQKALLEKGVDAKRIHREDFTLSVSEASLDELEEKERKVTILLKGEKHNLTVQPNESILERALEEGLDMPYSCQMGICSSCRTKLLSGQVKLVDQSVLSDEEIESGFTLTCVGYPASDSVVVNYDDPSLDE